MKVFFSAMIIVFLSSSVFAATSPRIYAVVKNRTSYPWLHPVDTLWMSGKITFANGSTDSKTFEKLGPGGDVRLTKSHSCAITNVEVYFYRKGKRVAQCTKKTFIRLEYGGTVSIVAVGCWRAHPKHEAPYADVACTIEYVTTLGVHKHIHCDCKSV